jgi:GTP cyclohydrolase I
MKKDANLGYIVGNHLRSLGIETPMVYHMVESIPTDDQKITEIASRIKGCMTVLGLDLNDDSLHDTPNRVAKMWVHEIFSGLDYKNFPKITVIDNKMNCDEMVLVKDMTAISSCEHHLITVDQTCSIAYIPDRKVIGLSKLARVAKFFANRPEVQERYVAQVFETIKFLLETDNVAVSVKGKHYCGVEDINAVTVTNKLGGLFKTDAACRNEFFKCLEN